VSTVLLTIVVVLAAASALLALLDVARDRDPSWWTAGALVALEVALLVQVVVGLVRLAQTDRDVSGLPFTLYLLGAVLVPPIAFLWAATERSRWGTSVIVVGALAVIALELRLDQIWGG
jgi:hypothetical protein